MTRFIPTCVGNTIASAQINPLPSVHPHMRGEHLKPCYKIFLILGSSPHAWGTPSISGPHVGDDRFIPTCVGNTTRYAWTRAEITVHPHMRGEHGARAPDAVGPDGSSPHAWGTRRLKVPFLDTDRFIPTCVGNTLSAAIAALTRSVHPHMRGEHSLSARTTASTTGSSPHAWGTHLR